MESFGESQGVVTDLERPFAEPPELEEVDGEAEAAPARTRAREGLPAGFRMRHDAHYVDQLTRDAGHHAVRPIAIADIDAFEEVVVPADVGPLAESIRRVGVLEPLLVRADHGRFRLITGRQRLRAAVDAGARTVPCIVHDVDEPTAASLRDAASVRVVPAAIAPEPPVDVAAAALASVLEGLAAATACASLADGSRGAVTTSVASALLKVELARAERIAQSAAAILRPPVPAREWVSIGALADAIASAAVPIRRGTGIEIECSAADERLRVNADGRLVRAAVQGVIDALLVIVAAARGTSVRVALRPAPGTPALAVRITQTAAPVSDAAIARFFDEGPDHPCGAAGALQLAAAAQIFRMHGGRADVSRELPAGCTVTLVLPQDGLRADG
jgi:hypothetical protein